MSLQVVHWLPSLHQTHRFLFVLDRSPNVKIVSPPSEILIDSRLWRRGYNCYRYNIHSFIITK